MSSVTFCTEKLFKVLVIGDLGVGKSSIIRRYVNKRFSDGYKASVGVDFALKTIEWDSNTVVRLQLWDIAGQERFRKMSRVYYREAMGAFVVFNVTQSSSLETASVWKQDLDTNVGLDSGRPIPAVLLANKCDLTGDTRDQQDLDQFCKDNHFLCWFETSAKDNVNIDEAAAFLVKHMMQCDSSLSRGEEENLWDQRIKVDQSPEENQVQDFCCWGKK